MYVRGGARFLGIVWQERGSLLGLAIMAAVTELIEPYIPHTDLFSVTYVAVFSTALSIFLVFRFNEAYERWWEARKLWGQIVNQSRDFARQVLTLLPEDERRAAGASLIRGQIAYVHALRISLRNGSTPDARAEFAPMLRRLVPDSAADVLRRDNIPVALLQIQSERLATLLRGSPEDAILLSRFDTTFDALVDAQGGCERIRNTVFPDAVSLITRLLVWGLAFLLFMATLGPKGWDGVVTTVAVAAIAMGFIWIDSMGRDLKDPFEGTPNDIPMTSLSVTIERDLLQMLGESELPERIQPVKGVLM